MNESEIKAPEAAAPDMTTVIGVSFRNATKTDIENVQAARIATYGQDNTEILRKNKSVDVKVKEQ